MNKLEIIQNKLKQLQKLFNYNFSVEIFLDGSLILHRENRTLSAVDKSGDYENYEELIQDIDRLIEEREDDFWLMD